MFWSQKNQPREQLRDELRLRLRVAADFATLGAYELSGPDDEASPSEVRPRVVREAPPKRVLLFAKVAVPCPASGPVEDRRCTAKEIRARRKSTRRRQRGGAVTTPEQPCLCAGDRASG